MNNTGIAITTIVTIHNAEKYLEECLISLVNQTFSDIEILCIDGGSTDATPEILTRYAKNDARIRIINDTNTSYGHKVNRGIEEAKGKYISVLESDDMYQLYMLEKLYEKAEIFQTDYVDADYISFFDIQGQRFTYPVKMYDEKSYNCVVENRKYPERIGVTTRFWTGLFRKEFLNREHIRMNESPGASYQDMSFRFLTAVLAERSYHMDIPVYLYRIDNPGSSMHDTKKTVVIADEHDYLKSELEKRNISSRYIWNNAYQWKYLDFRGNMKHLKGRYRQELFLRYRQELEKDRKILEELADLGYRQAVREMIYESPERVEAYIEKDAAEEFEREQSIFDGIQYLMTVPEGKIVLFGIGRRGKFVLEVLKNNKDRIVCLTDNAKEKWNSVYDGHTVLSPKDAIKKFPDAVFLIAVKEQKKEIKKQLEGMGINAGKII